MQTRLSVYQNSEKKQVGPPLHNHIPRPLPDLILDILPPSAPKHHSWRSFCPCTTLALTLSLWHQKEAVIVQREPCLLTFSSPLIPHLVICKKIESELTWKRTISTTFQPGRRKRPAKPPVANGTVVAHINVTEATRNCVLLVNDDEGLCAYLGPARPRLYIPPSYHATKGKSAIVSTILLIFIFSASAFTRCLNTLQSPSWCSIKALIFPASSPNILSHNGTSLSSCLALTATHPPQVLVSIKKYAWYVHSSISVPPPHLMKCA